MSGIVGSQPSHVFPARSSFPVSNPSSSMGAFHGQIEASAGNKCIQLSDRSSIGKVLNVLA
jgi:hypothetical protein